MKKISLSIIVILLCAGVWILGKDKLSATPDSKIKYILATVEKRDMINTVSATGTLSALVTVEVGSQISGLIKTLQADYNSQVKENQVIARIDPEGYTALVLQSEAEFDIAKAQLGIAKAEISGHKAELENAQANLDAYRAMVKKARATVANAKLNMERQKSLFEQDFVARNDYDLAKTNFEESAAQFEQALAQEKAAQSKVTSARVALTIANATIKESEAQVRLKIAALDKRKIDLENTIIRSPVDGVVIARSVDVGQTVAASLQAPVLFTIAQDLHKMQVSTSVDEADIGQIKEGQTAWFTVDAFGSRKYKGTVAQIRKMGQTVQNVVTYEVILSVNNSDLSLMPGMTADVSIEVLKRTNILTILNAALRFTLPEGETIADQPAFTESSQGRLNTESKIKTYTEALELDSSQQDKLRKIFFEIGEKMKMARSNSAAHPKGGGSIREKLRKESQAAISRILNSEQKERFDVMLTQKQPKRGTLWCLNEKGLPAVVRVTLGVSDSSYTEISGRNLVEGMKIITGIE